MNTFAPLPIATPLVATAFVAGPFVTSAPVPIATALSDATPIFAPPPRAVPLRLPTAEKFPSATPFSAIEAIFVSFPMPTEPSPSALAPEPIATLCDAAALDAMPSATEFSPSAFVSAPTAVAPFVWTRTVPVTMSTANSPAWDPAPKAVLFVVGAFAALPSAVESTSKAFALNPMAVAPVTFPKLGTTEPALAKPPTLTEPPPKDSAEAPNATPGLTTTKSSPEWVSAERPMAILPPPLAMLPGPIPIVPSPVAFGPGKVGPAGRILKNGLPFRTILFTVFSSIFNWLPFTASLLPKATVPSATLTIRRSNTPALPTETTLSCPAIDPEPSATAFVMPSKVSALEPNAREASARAFAPKPTATAFKASKSSPNVIASPPASAPAPSANAPDENAFACAPNADDFISRAVA